MERKRNRQRRYNQVMQPDQIIYREGHMSAEENLRRISDGKLYGVHDMAKIGCHGCEGCSRCCRGMGESVILDPYDAYQLTTGLGQTFGQLLSDSVVELHVTDGLIVPNLKMRADSDACVFLNENGRCRIHTFRLAYAAFFRWDAIMTAGRLLILCFGKNARCRIKQKSELTNGLTRRT